MNKVDECYLDFLRDVMENGTVKETRSGTVKSVFGRQFKFDLKQGIPLLTTKKVFYKGIIHELLWHLGKGIRYDNIVNIEYLSRNNVHIWDDDAYRWFRTRAAQGEFNSISEIKVCTRDGLTFEASEFEDWINPSHKLLTKGWIHEINKDEFIDLTLQKVEIWCSDGNRYRFGDLGATYGSQWRRYGKSNIDQINEIITKLKTSPNDRRMICIAYNQDYLNKMALPPCHVMMQFYTRELTDEEREPYSHMTIVPKYGLSCMFVMRSNDICCGTPFNWAQYAMLTYMIAKVVGMVPDELTYSVGDAHIYSNHFDGVKEQLDRKGSDVIPKLVLNGEQETIDDFKFEDFEIRDYEPDGVIKFPLNVG